MPSSHVISTSNTIVPRYLAATFDNLFSLLLALLVAKRVSDDAIAMQTLSFILVYLGYYFAFEVWIGRTPGKLMAGLVVVRKDGTRCSTRDVAIRTAMRLLEVNPALLGALPAALCIIFSANHQRFGDMLAGTIVVPKSRVPLEAMV
jgi:uncharacterized RDD family membrane protein YckC